MSFAAKMRISTLTALLAAAPVQAETLYQKDGITLTGTSRVVGRGVATCQVLEEKHTPEVYERMKAYDGQPMHVWRMDFAAYNESGKWLEHLTANLKVSVDPPPCSTWSGPDVTYPKTVQWGGSFEVLQRPYGMGPGDEARDTIFVLTIHDREPAFESWDVDYKFAPGSEQKPKRPTTQKQKTEIEAQDVSPGPPASPPTTQGSTEAVRRTGGTTDGPKEHDSLLDASRNPQVPAQLACDLGKWATIEYFSTATVQDVKACLAAGADLTVQSPSFEFTPLHLAASFSNPEVVTALLAAGADPNDKWDGEWIPLYLVFERNRKNQLGMVKALIAGGASVHERSGLGGDDTVLHTAAKYATTPEVIHVLLDAGANPVARTKAGITPTCHAASNENLAVLEALLAVGGNVVIQSSITGWTCLHSAARHNDNPAVIERIIAEGAKLEARNYRGKTPLHAAADYYETAPAIRVLLKAGANLEARDDEGNTPLHLAAAYEGPLREHAGDAIKIKALLEAGANPHARNNKGETPWDLAQANKSLKGTDAYWLLNQARFK